MSPVKILPFSKLPILEILLGFQKYHLFNQQVRSHLGRVPAAFATPLAHSSQADPGGRGPRANSAFP